jgi:hypothetical protein
MKFKDFFYNELFLEANTEKHKVELIEESKKIQRYLSIFNKLSKTHPEYISMFERIVEQAVRRLKRDDIINWFLIGFRIRFINSLQGGENYYSPERLYMQYRDSVLNKLEHFLSLPVKAIQDYRFDLKENTADVFSKFENWEKEWQKENKGWIDITDELQNDEIDIIESFPDGFVWMDLQKPYCEKEGDLMGHCGNKASYEPDDTVLSLRKIEKRNGRTFARPSLTFILRKGGFLGEMKGRANEKPNAKYHPYIIKLLTDSVFRVSTRTDETEYLVKGIVGGGYEPKNNFSLNDLSEENKKKLYTLRPDLEPLADRYARGEVADDEIIDRLASWLDVPKEKITITKSPNGFASAQILFWDNWEQLFDSLHDIPENLKQYRNTVENGYAEWHYDSHIDSQRIKDFFGEIFDQPKVQNVVQKLFKKAVEDQSLEITDLPTDYREIYDILTDWDHTFADCLRSGIHSGEESGIADEVIKKFKEGITDLNLSFPAVDNSISLEFAPVFKNGIQWFDSPINIFLSLNELNKVDIEFDKSEVFVDSGDMSVPYYGFDGFDESVAIDRFLDEVSTELDLSSINRNMAIKQTIFDNVYNNILLELDFSKGGISNQSGVQSQGASMAPTGVNTKPNTGTQMQSAGKQKFSATTPGAANQASTTNTQQQQQQDPVELEEFNNLMALRTQNKAKFQKNTQQLLQDPDKYNRFLDFAMQPVK